MDSKVTIVTFIDDIALGSVDLTPAEHRAFTKSVARALVAFGLLIPSKKLLVAPSETMVFLGLANTPRGLTALPSTRTSILTAYDQLMSRGRTKDLLSLAGTA